MFLRFFILRNHIIIIRNKFQIKKEELDTIMKTRPINLQFIPQSLQIPFQQKLKLQLAFYRHNKVCKTKPMKFLYQNITKFNDNNIPIINFGEEQLTFCTTIGQQKQKNSFESKQINVQVACDINGNKQILEGKIDLKNYMKNQQIFEHKQICLEFVGKSMAFILIFDMKVRFEDNDQLKLKQASAIEDKKQIKSAGIKTGRQNIIDGSEKIKQKMNNKQNYNSVNKNQQKKIRQIKFSEQAVQDIDKQQSPPDSPKFKEDTPKKRSKQAISRKKSRHKTQKTEKGETQQKQNKYNNSENEDLRSQISLLKQSHGEQIKRLQSQINKLKTSLQNLQNSTNDLERQKQNLQKKQKKSKNDLKNKQDQIKRLQKQIRQWQINRQTNNSEKNSALAQLNKKYVELQAKFKVSSKDEEQWRRKYQQSQNTSLKLIAQKSQLEYELEKTKKQVQKLKQQFNSDRIQMEQQLQSIRDQYSRKRNVDNSNQEIQKIRKQLHKKQQIIKKLQRAQNSKQGQFQRECSSLKQQNMELRQMIDNLKKSSDKSDGVKTALDLKIVSEKLKKQCDLAKKMEKNLLVQKSQLQNRNKGMSQQLIKLKQTIAKMLNLIQQQGSSELFTKITDCII